MSVTVPLTSDEQAALEAQAKSHGISVDSLLRKAVLQVISREQAGKPSLTVEEFDRAFEEIADMIPEGIPALSDQALSRESIYTREDEWNRNPR
jgi:hypothetical protein